VESRASVTALESHSETILEVRFQPKSTRFATSSCDGTIKLWDAKKVSLFLFISPSTPSSASVLPF